MEEEPTEEELSDLHRAFAEQYLICMNATKAYLKVYPDSSRESANANACRLMKTSGISEEIKRLRKERSERCAIEADDVIKELKLLAYSDMDDYVEFGPAGVTLKEMSEMPTEMTRAIVEVSHNFTSEGGGSIKFKLADKRPALVDIGKHLGMFVDKIDHSGELKITEIKRTIVEPEKK